MVDGTVAVKDKAGHLVRGRGRGHLVRGRGRGRPTPTPNQIKPDTLERGWRTAWAWGRRRGLNRGWGWDRHGALSLTASLRVIFRVF